MNELSGVAYLTSEPRRPTASGDPETDACNEMTHISDLTVYALAAKWLSREFMDKLVDEFGEAGLPPRFMVIDDKLLRRDDWPIEPACIKWRRGFDRDEPHWRYRPAEEVARSLRAA